MELLLYRKAHPDRTVYGQVIFLNAGSDEPDWPWADWVERGPLRKPVYIAQGSEESPKTTTGSPTVGSLFALVRQRPATGATSAGDLTKIRDLHRTRRYSPAGCVLETFTEPGATVLLDVFMSWMMERYKGQTYEEVLRMLQVLTPLEETRAYKELVGKGERLGRQKAALELLTKQLHRPFGRLPRWASERLCQADLKPSVPSQTDSALFASLVTNHALQAHGERVPTPAMKWAARTSCRPMNALRCLDRRAQPPFHCLPGHEYPLRRAGD
jgi:hypothetical protein